jgi:Tol biopolymer transport system component
MITADQLWLRGAATSILATRGDWSPDGTRLLLRLVDGPLAVLSVETGALTKLAVKTYDFTWSPDGKQIAYIAKDKLWIATADGSRPRAVLAVPDGGGLAWQPLPQ